MIRLLHSKIQWLHQTMYSAALESYQITFKQCFPYLSNIHQYLSALLGNGMIYKKKNIHLNN